MQYDALKANRNLNIAIGRSRKILCTVTSTAHTATKRPAIESNRHELPCLACHGSKTIHTTMLGAEITGKSIQNVCKTLELIRFGRLYRYSMKNLDSTGHSHIESVYCINILKLLFLLVLACEHRPDGLRTKIHIKNTF